MPTDVNRCPWMPFCFSHLLFIQLRTPAQRIALPTCSVRLPASVKPPWNALTDMPRNLFQMILSRGLPHTQELWLPLSPSHGYSVHDQSVQGSWPVQSPVCLQECLPFSVHAVSARSEGCPVWTDPFPFFLEMNFRAAS